MQDKERGAGVDFGLMTDFMEVIEKCGLRDLPFTDNRFTWDNGRSGDAFIQECIDLGFANDVFLNVFSGTQAVHVTRENSDHVPVIFLLQP